MLPEASTLAGVAGRKALRRLLPFLLLMYVLAFLDRANIGFAQKALQHDTGLSDAAFAFGAGVFFVGYALFEVPSNLVLHRVGARIWMCRIMVTWGLISAAMAWVQSPTSFYVLRFLLGVAEAGFFPGIIYYLTCWFPARVRGQILTQAFHGATELIRVQCGDELVLVARTQGGSSLHSDVELEFDPADAVPVRESGERI